MSEPYWTCKPDMRDGYGDGPFDAFNGELEVTNAHGHIMFAVTQEQAVDSYNHAFTCDAALTLEQARELRDWLTRALSQ